MTGTIDDAAAVAERRPPVPVGRRRAARRRIRLQEAALPVVVVLLLIVGTIADRRQPFLTSDNLLTVLTQASVTGVVAVGMTFVIATGGIDLSVGSMLAAAAIAGGLVERRSTRHDVHVLVITIGFAWCSGRSTASPSPTAGSCRSSPRWPCSPSPAAWPCG